MDFFGYDELATSAVVLVAALAAITVIWNAVKALREMRQPVRDMQAQIEEHQRKLDDDFKRMEDLKHSNELQIKALMQLINHELDGNHVDKLEEVRDELQGYLITR